MKWQLRGEQEGLTSRLWVPCRTSVRRPSGRRAHTGHLSTQLSAAHHGPVHPCWETEAPMLWPP